MDQNKAKWLALISLYLVQGLPHGFFGQAMPVLLREQGVDLKHIGLMALVALPWALKFLWAPMLDRFTLFPRHWPDEFRRSWILAMNYSAAALLIAISFMPLDWIATDGLLLFGVLLIGINVLIDLVKPGTLPRTSSGKLSRSQSRAGYFERLAESGQARLIPGIGNRRIA